MSVATTLESLLELAGLPTPLPDDPMPTLARWLDEARKAADTPDPDAFTLATVAADGRPSARIVLCKGLDPAAGALLFFTNYDSRKASEVDATSRVAGVFHWGDAGRQARFEGRATRASEKASDDYFASRPILARLGAWASEQSRPLAARTDLLRALRRAMDRFGVSALDVLANRAGPTIPRPPYWGGYQVHLDAVELWVGGGGRLHDRARWQRSVDPVGPWAGQRLQP
ncbi:MAG: pyridoxamine 5'-phosphate oxidase [Phycisphaerae bacterium]|nr:pyridoxamine 5'-phosphate oxidase [Phycisphaerae bacterium]